MAAVTSWPGIALAMEAKEQTEYNLLSPKNKTTTSNQTFDQQSEKEQSTLLKSYTGKQTDDDSASTYSKAGQEMKYDAQSAKTAPSSFYLNGVSIGNETNVPIKKKAKKRQPLTCCKGCFKFFFSCCYKKNTHLDSSDSDSENTPLAVKNRNYSPLGSVNNDFNLLQTSNINHVTITEIGLGSYNPSPGYVDSSVVTQKVQAVNLGPEYFKSVIDPAIYSEKQSKKSFKSTPKTSNLTLISSGGSLQEQGKEQGRYAGVTPNKRDQIYIYGQNNKSTQQSPQGSACREENPLSGNSYSVNEDKVQESTQDDNHFEFINKTETTDIKDLKTVRTYEDRNQTIKGAPRKSKELLDYTPHKRNAETDKNVPMYVAVIGRESGDYTIVNDSEEGPNLQKLMGGSDNLSESEFDIPAILQQNRTICDIPAILEENSTTWEKIKRFFCR